MGFEVIRFVASDVNNDLICIICKGVLEDPVWAQHCEHAFCRVCITKWLSRRHSCPNDRQDLLPSQLKPIPRFMRNILDKLEIKCEFHSLGCDLILKLESLRQHVCVCDFNPEKLIECERGCGLIIKKADLTEHNCVKDLRKKLNEVMEESIKTDRMLCAIRYEMNTLRNDNNRLNELTLALENDVKHLKQVVNVKRPVTSDICSLSGITDPQTSSSSAAVKSSAERGSRLVPNPYVLITPLRPLSASSPLNACDEPSSSTINESTGRLSNDEPVYKRRVTAIRPTIQSAHMDLFHSNSSGPYLHALSTLRTRSPTNEAREDSRTTITIGDIDSYGYITLDTNLDEDSEENQPNEDVDEEDISVSGIHRDDYEFDE